MAKANNSSNNPSVKTDGNEMHKLIYSLPLASAKGILKHKTGFSQKLRPVVLKIQSQNKPLCTSCLGGLILFLQNGRNHLERF
ncbi:hypothetical protein SAMN06297358_3512 [Pedobacter xixiisoli]|uniref:Uncharacterized protein n=1 Tax=Pedobacter xixiisoli TaxID=1476464 RepID=A0A286AD28_9SPHI|nr:hypothetical protein SAMN06297358_3512 [Pedobacter xixiisoli]